MRVSRGKAEIDIELYDQFRDLEKAFKANSLLRYDSYGDQYLVYSRTAFDKEQLEKISNLEKANAQLFQDNEKAREEIKRLSAMPYGLVVEKPSVKDLSIFQFIKLKLRG